MACLKQTSSLLFGILFSVAILAPAELFTADSSAEGAQRPRRRPRRTENKTEPPPKNQPIALVNAASAKRLLDDVESTFKHANKPELYDVIKGYLGNVDNLKGMDQEKPFGVMVFLGTGFPPTPTAVGYIPVKNIGELLKSIAGGPFTSKPVEGIPNRYELIGDRGSAYIAVVDGYAFVSDKLENLDRDFPNPAEVAGALSKRYDLAAAINLNSVAKDSRELFASVFRIAAEGELQQRDGEPKAAYEARRAQGERDIDFVEAMLLDCEKLIVGLDASGETNNIVFELNIESRPSSKLAKLLKAIGGKRSYFEPLQDDSKALAVALSWGLNQRDRKLMVQSLQLFGSRLTAILDPESITWKPPGEEQDGKKKPDQADKKQPDPGPDGDAERRAERQRRRDGFRRRFDRDRRFQPGPLGDYTKDGPVGRLIEPLIATAESGHADFFLQFAGEPPAKFSVLGGMKLANGRQFAVGLKDTLEKLKTRENAPEIKLNAETHRGIAFHQIRFSRVPGQMRRFFGNSPAVYVGASSQAVWIAIGEDAAFTELQAAVDKVFERKPSQKTGNAGVAPLHVAVNVSRWLAMGEVNDGRPRPRREIAKKAFAKGGDDVRVEVRTSDTGMRIRAKFGSGFLKFIGMDVARRYERNLGL